MVFIIGFFLGISLIISIGAQNLFVIKQGFIKQHSILVPLICTLSDALLITLSVTTLGKIIFHISVVKDIMLIFAMIFLIWYGGYSLYRGITTKSHSLTLNNQPGDYKNTRWKIIIITSGFSLLNPQAVMEMMIIMGGTASHYHSNLQWQFILGAIIASSVWFFSLTWISRLCFKIILRPEIWRTMEILSGIIMLIIAIKCLIMLGVRPQ